MLKILNAAAKVFLFLQFFSLKSIEAQNPWRQIDALNYVVSFFERPASSYENAKSICENIGAAIIQLDDLFAREAVYDHIEQTKMYWIGAERYGPGDNDWNWADGTPVNMSLINWHLSQPDNNRGEESSMALWGATMTFFDDDPSLNYLYPICQKRNGINAPWKLETMDYHLTFYDEEASDWNASNETCAGINATMIKLDDNNVRDGVLKAIKTAENVDYFWIGATGEYEETNAMFDWTWLDGTPVNMTLIQWLPGQPENDTDQNKLIIRTDNAMFENEAENFSQAGTICLRKKGDYCEENVNTCRNGGTCTALSEDPFFRCDCVDEFYGEYCRISGKPTILNITNNDCNVNGKITMLWKPSASSSDLMHRLAAFPLDPAEAQEEYFYTSSHTGEAQYNSFTHLDTSTLYEITITVCPYGANCIHELATYANATTGFGLPKLVEDATVAKINNSLCRLYWDFPSSDPQDKIESFRIVSTSSYVYQPQNEDTEDIVDEVDTGTDVLEYSFGTVPNREYTFTVAARSCAGLGPNISAVGECITDFAPPNDIDSPVHFLQKPSTKRELLLKMPDETNGPISCIFVIVKVGSIDNLKEQFDINDLYQVSINALGEEAPIGTEYLTDAIQRSSITETPFNITLGKGNVSVCGVSQYGGNTPLTDNIYVGKNWQLRIGHEYSYYVVTSTPTGPNVTTFQRSPIGSFRNGSPIIVGNMRWMTSLAFCIAAFLRRNGHF